MDDDKLIEELLTTLANEINNQRNWIFDGRRVQGSELATSLGDDPGLLLSLDDDTTVVVTAQVLDD